MRLSNGGLKKITSYTRNKNTKIMIASLFKVETDKLEPVLYENDIIECNKVDLSDRDMINKLCVVDYEDGCIAGKVEEIKGDQLAISFSNNKYPNMKISLSKVKSIYLAKNLVSRYISI